MPRARARAPSSAEPGGRGGDSNGGPGVDLNHQLPYAHDAPEQAPPAAIAGPADRYGAAAARRRFPRNRRHPALLAQAYRARPLSRGYHQGYNRYWGGRLQGWNGNGYRGWPGRYGRYGGRYGGWPGRYGGWPGWGNPGWAVARPWNCGWYGNWIQPPWGWWGGSSLVWGLGGLASAAVINGAMQQAISARRPTIPVADTDQNLIFASLEPSDSGSVRFTATDGDAPFEASADCRQGQLNGHAPASAAEAQMLHTACQVAFGR
ncbi:MAG: hypothetical protein ACKO25_09775 [Cyanobium sp.]